MDIPEAKEILKQNSFWKNFIKDYWRDFEEYAKVQDFSENILIQNDESVNRVVYVILAGDIEAYTVTKDDAKLISICKFTQGMTIGDVQAIFGQSWSFGLRTLTKTSVLAIDLDLIEHTTQNYEMYEFLFNMIHSELGVLTAEINNHRLQHNIKLKEILPLKFFDNFLDSLSKEELDFIRNNIKFIFFKDKTEILTKNALIDNFYFIKTGQVVVEHNNHNTPILSDDIIGDTDFFNTGYASENINTITPTLVLKFQIKNLLVSDLNELKNKIYKKFINKANKELKDTKNNFSNLVKDYEVNYSHIKKMSLLSLKMIIVLSVIHLCLYFDNHLHIFGDYKVLLHKFLSLVGICSVFAIIKKNNLNLKSIGFCSKNNKAYIESIIVTVALIIISLVWNELIIELFQNKIQLKFIYPEFVTKKDLYGGFYWYYILLAMIYIVIYEIILRGIWQNWLMSLFKGSFWVRAWKSIIVVNIIGAIFYQSLFYEFYFMMLISGLFFGYLYAKYKNLYAVIVAHIIYEIIMVTQVGLVVF
mgnify:FL=1|tara:strand:- start:24183 stop:25775 length:1593 start_codon:yes stop_codon:yes gene_type:complete